MTRTGPSSIPREAARPSSGAGMIGRRIDGYTITDVVGAGGMGTVYLARQQSPDRLVALKMMRPGMASPSMLRRFQYETEALARLQHEGIARIYEAGMWDDGGGAVPWFAMEYIPNALVLTDFANREQAFDRPAAGTVPKGLYRRAPRVTRRESSTGISSRETSSSTNGGIRRSSTSVSPRAPTPIPRSPRIARMSARSSAPFST